MAFGLLLKDVFSQVLKEEVSGVGIAETMTP